MSRRTDCQSFETACRGRTLPYLASQAEGYCRHAEIRPQGSVAWSCTAQESGTSSLLQSPSWVWPRVMHLQPRRRRNLFAPLIQAGYSKGHGWRSPGDRCGSPMAVLPVRQATRERPLDWWMWWMHAIKEFRPVDCDPFPVWGHSIQKRKQSCTFDMGFSYPGITGSSTMTQTISGLSRPVRISRMPGFSPEKCRRKSYYKNSLSASRPWGTTPINSNTRLRREMNKSASHDTQGFFAQLQRYTAAIRFRKLAT